MGILEREEVLALLLLLGPSEEDSTLPAEVERFIIASAKLIPGGMSKYELLNITNCRGEPKEPSVLVS